METMFGYQPIRKEDVAGEPMRAPLERHMRPEGDVQVGR